MKNILLIILLCCMIYLFTISNELTETLENSQQIIAMSFGGDSKNYHDAVSRISNELIETKVFNKVLKYTDEKLKSDFEFWNKHKDFIENNKRGYGYWLWKSYLIWKTLESMNDNDILFYLDSGCEVVNNHDTRNKLLSIANNCDKYNILYTSSGYLEKVWTKMDLFNYMNLMNDTILNSIQHQAGILIIKKTKITLDFVKDWYNHACNYNLINDKPSIIKNDDSFSENRHDQSVFSLLLKTDKYSTLNTKNNIIHDYPILVSRKRHG